jgi:hypothetical protein
MKRSEAENEANGRTPKNVKGGDEEEEAKDLITVHTLN